jgi:hypothetical protein
VCIMPNDDSFHELIFAPHILRFLLRWDFNELGLTGNGANKATAWEVPPVFLRNSKYFTYITD